MRGVTPRGSRLGRRSGTNHYGPDESSGPHVGQSGGSSTPRRHEYSRPQRHSRTSTTPSTASSSSGSSRMLYVRAASVTNGESVAPLAGVRGAFHADWPSALTIPRKWEVSETNPT